MLTAVVTVLLSFLLTGIVANLLIHRWQHRNWLSEQRFLGQEKEYIALRELFDQIVSAAGKRLARMRRLLWVLPDKREELVKERMKDYDQAQTKWNDSLSSFLVRLRMYAPYSMAVRLDDVIQPGFVRLGKQLERLTADRLSGQPIERMKLATLENDFNRLHGELIMFMRDMLNLVKAQRRKTYTGTRVFLNEQNLELFPTWELVKALFKPRVKSFSIVRSPVDIEPPSFGGD
jgi:hypothetical protein